jgi:DNA-binding response OmpR family regulator
LVACALVQDTVLIIEDDPSIAELLGLALEQEGFRSLWASDGQLGLDMFVSERPVAVLLDLRLPRLSGLEVLRELRRVSEIPVLIMSVKDQEADKVAGLELGADDYVTKPFSPRELMARLRRNLRKGKLTQTQLGGLLVDWQRADVFRDGARLLLTAREFELLRVLYENRERILERDALLEKVWGYDYDGDERVVDTTIKRLRRKVGQDLIETVRGLGYRLSAS